MAPASSHQARPEVATPRPALESRRKACRGSERKTRLKLGGSEGKPPDTKKLGGQKRTPRVMWQADVPSEQPQDKTGTEKTPASPCVTWKTVVALPGSHPLLDEGMNSEITSVSLTIIVV